MAWRAGQPRRLRHRRTAALPGRAATGVLGGASTRARSSSAAATAPFAIADIRRRAGSRRRRTGRRPRRHAARLSSDGPAGRSGERIVISVRPHPHRAGHDGRLGRSSARLPDDDRRADGRCHRRRLRPGAPAPSSMGRRPAATCSRTSSPRTPRTRQSIPTSAYSRRATLTGRPFATLLDFSAHATVLGSDNTKVSGDWVSAANPHARRALRRGADDGGRHPRPHPARRPRLQLRAAAAEGGDARLCARSAPTPSASSSVPRPPRRRARPLGGRPAVARTATWSPTSDHARSCSGSSTPAT